MVVHPLTPCHHPRQARPLWVGCRRQSPKLVRTANPMSNTCVR